MTADNLRMLCRKKRLKVSGNKTELVRKLVSPTARDRAAEPAPGSEGEGTSLHSNPNNSMYLSGSAAAGEDGDTGMASFIAPDESFVSLDGAPSQVVRDRRMGLSERAWRGRARADTSGAPPGSATLAADSMPRMYRDSEPGEDDRSGGSLSDSPAANEEARDHDTPWTVMGQKQLKMLLRSPAAMRRAKPGRPRYAGRWADSSAGVAEERMAQGGGSGQGQPEMAKISEADFERVLGKRYVRPVNAHGALAQARPPTPVPQAIDAGQQDVAFYMGLAGTKLQEAWGTESGTRK